MTKFLKGDSTAAITLALAQGFDYSGKTVHLEYQGARRSFSGVAAGDILTFSFTAEETAPMSLGAYPVRVWMEDERGGTTTIRNADAKLCVTDCAADVHSDSAIYIDVRGGLYGIEGLPERYTDEDLRRKIHEILRRLGGTVAAFALALLPAFGATVDVQTAPKGTIYNDEQVVTNVVVDVSDLATTGNVAVASAAAKEYTDAAISGKQDALPYPTNAIPWTAVSQRPNMDEYATTGQLATAVGAIPEPDFTVSNDTLVATIEATAPAPGNYAAVSNAAMNAVQSQSMTNYATRAELEAGWWSEWTCEPSYIKINYVRYDEDREKWHIQYETASPVDIYVDGLEDDTILSFIDKGIHYTLTRHYIAGPVPTKPADIGAASPGTVSNIVTKVYVEGLGISSEETDPSIGLTNGTIYVKGSTITPLTSHQSLSGYVPTSRTVNSKPLSSNVTLGASDVGAYSSTDGATLAGQVATIGAHLNAEDARFVVTNYNSVTHTPEAYVEIRLPDTSWSRIWSEMTRWNWLFDYFMPSNYYGKAAIDTALADKADRAWGFYDSTTGEYAPDGYTWISSEKIAIAANLAYQRTVTTEGAIWVLESNGTVTETGGLTNGFFRISDDEGNSLFEIVKGSKRTIGADASSCQIVSGFTPTKLQIGYSVVSDVHPTLYVCQSLATQNWKAETDSDCLANVSWSGTSGAYVAQVQGKSAYSPLFVKATYEVGGETYINNAAPVSMQYIMLNGVKYSVGTATISGNTVLTLTVAP